MWVTTETGATRRLAWREEDGERRVLEFDEDGWARCKQEVAEAAENRFGGVTTASSKGEPRPDAPSRRSPPEEGEGGQRDEETEGAEGASEQEGPEADTGEETDE